MRIEIINKIKDFLKEHPDSTIKFIANSLGKSESTIRDYIYFIMGSDHSIIENRNNYPFTFSLKVEQIEEPFSLKKEYDEMQKRYLRNSLIQSAFDQKVASKVLLKSIDLEIAKVKYGNKQKKLSKS